jgi:hypothetical protein
MLAPPAGSLPLPRWAWGPLSVPSRPGTPGNMLQVKTKGKVCVHALPHATSAPEPASLLREGSNVATCPRLRTPPRRLGEVRRCHASLSTGSRLTAKEGSDTDTHHSASDRIRLRGGLRC